MKADDEKLYKELNEKELTRYQLLDLTFGMKELADAIGARNAWETLRHTREAIRHLQEFRGQIIPTHTLTEDEANLSAALHTYMRKGMDCPLGTVLYRLISEDRGKNIWYSFIKALAAERNNPKMVKKTPKSLYHSAMAGADSAYDMASDTTDDLFMLSALRMWEHEFHLALEWMEWTPAS